MSIVLANSQKFRAADECIILKFERKFIERKGGKTKIVSAHPLLHDPHISHKMRSLSGSQKPSIMEVLHKEKEVIIYLNLLY